MTSVQFRLLRSASRPNIPYSSQFPEVEEWLTPILDKLEALSPDAKVNQEMHTRRIVEALSNAVSNLWQREREQGREDETLRKDLFANVVREYFEKTRRRDSK